MLAPKKKGRTRREKETAIEKERYDKYEKERNHYRNASEDVKENLVGELSSKLIMKTLKSKDIK